VGEVVSVPRQEIWFEFVKGNPRSVWMVLQEQGGMDFRDHFLQKVMLLFSVWLIFLFPVKIIFV
jgi:hypothetical protein